MIILENGLERKKLIYFHFGNMWGSCKESLQQILQDRYDAQM